MQLTASDMSKRLGSQVRTAPKGRAASPGAALPRLRAEIEAQVSLQCPGFDEFATAIRRFAGSRFASASKEVIGIAGSRPGEGKTTVALMLASALSEMHQRVVFVEADGGSRTLLEELGETPRAGLSDWLQGQASLSDILYQTARPHLSAVPFGQEPLLKPTLQTLAPLNTLLSALRAGFDIVLVDLPPLLSHEAAPALLKQLDCAVLVAAANETRRDEINRAVQLCEDVPVAGILLNKLSRKAPSWLTSLLVPANGTDAT